MYQKDHMDHHYPSFRHESRDMNYLKILTDYDNYQKDNHHN